MKKLYSYEKAAAYMRYLQGKGITAIICEAYNWQEQRTVYTVQERSTI